MSANDHPVGSGGESTATGPGLIEHDQPTAPGKERETFPILGGDIANISHMEGVQEKGGEYSDPHLDLSIMEGL